MVVKALSFQCADVGKNIKQTKKRYVWRLEIDEKEHVIELLNSVLSGKKEIFFNRQSIFNGVKMFGFQHSFSIGHNMINLLSQGEGFDLRINNQFFSHLQTQDRVKQEFQYDDPRNDIPGNWGDVKSARKQHQTSDDENDKPKNYSQRSKSSNQKKTVDESIFGGFDKFDQQSRNKQTTSPQQWGEGFDKNNKNSNDKKQMNFDSNFGDFQEQRKTPAKDFAQFGQSNSNQKSQGFDFEGFQNNFSENKQSKNNVFSNGFEQNFSQPTNKSQPNKFQMGVVDLLDMDIDPQENVNQNISPIKNLKPQNEIKSQIANLYQQNQPQNNLYQSYNLPQQQPFQGSYQQNFDNAFAGLNQNQNSSIYQNNVNQSQNYNQNYRPPQQSFNMQNINAYNQQGFNQNTNQQQSHIRPQPNQQQQSSQSTPFDNLF